MANNATNANIVRDILTFNYIYKVYLLDIYSKITQLTKEWLGIRSTPWVLDISVTTLFKRIVQIDSKIKQPPIIVSRPTK